MGTNRVTRRDDGSATRALDCQTRVEPLGSSSDPSESQVTRLPPRIDPQLLAAKPNLPARDSRCTEEALRVIAARLDRVAAAYLASLRNGGSR